MNARWRHSRALINAQFRMIRREQAELRALAQGEAATCAAALRLEAQQLVIALIRAALK